VRNQRNKLKGAALDVWEEEVISGGKDGADGISSNLFLNGDSAVDVEQFVEIKIFYLDLGITICISLPGNSNCIGRR
jgi:hypothetical protein